MITNETGLTDTGRLQFFAFSSINQNMMIVTYSIDDREIHIHRVRRPANSRVGPSQHRCAPHFLYFCIFIYSRRVTTRDSKFSTHSSSPPRPLNRTDIDTSNTRPFIQFTYPYQWSSIVLYITGYPFEFAVKRTARPYFFSF